MAAVLALAACQSGGGAGDGAEPAPVTVPEPGTVLVVVELAVDYEPEAELGPREVADQRAEIAEAQDAVLAELGEHGELAGRPQRLPQLALRVDEEGLRLLDASPYVRGVEANEPEPPTGS